MTFKYQVARYFTKPQLLKKTPSLTVEQILLKSRRPSRLKARRVRVLSIDVMKPVSILPTYTVYRLVTLNEMNGHRYKLTIFSEGRKVTRKSKLLIDDPCPVYVYRYEYAMAKRGNGFIYRCNGDPPVMTNPRMIPGLSHHGIRAVLDLIKYTSRMKNE